MSDDKSIAALALTALVLVACAHARPGANDIDDHQASSNSITEDSNQETSAESRSRHRPLNLRFPHAVLFGGTCGGSIISPTWVITAAHCSIFSSGRSVLAGTDNSDDGSGKSVHVKRLIVHPKFSVGPYWLNANDFNITQVGARWDFMLVELAEPLDINGRTIATVKLNDEPIIAPGTQVSFAGYGAASHGEYMRSEMHVMELITLSDKECEKLEQYDKLDMICVQGRPPRYDSACNGDSGSGLVTEDGRLLGVASWVENDAIECKNGAYVVFSRLSLVRDWIRNITGV